MACRTWLAAILFALLSFFPGPAPVRAAEEGDDGASFHPADVNEDGEVTNRELRRYNRQQRRAARRARRKAGDGSDDDEPEVVGAAVDASPGGSGPTSAGGRKAMSRANKAAQALKASMTDASALGSLAGGGGSSLSGGSLGGGGALGGGSMGAGGGSGALGALGSMAGPGGGQSGVSGVKSFGGSGGGQQKPSLASELVLLSKTGFGPAMKKEGYRVGVGPDGRETILRSDGTVATATDLERLKARIDSEPRAVIHRPDFFAVLPEAKYQSLKGEYHQHPEMSQKEFKHVELTDKDRDFVRSKSCSKVSGDCNQYAEHDYKKGDDVPPEDLSKMWDAIHDELTNGPADASSGSGGLVSAGEVRRRLGWVLDLADSFMGTGGGGASKGSVSGAGGEAGVGYGGEVAGGVATTQGKSKGPASVIPLPEALKKTGVRRGLLGLLAVGLIGTGLFFRFAKSH